MLSELVREVVYAVNVFFEDKGKSTGAYIPINLNSIRLLKNVMADSAENVYQGLILVFPK